MTTALAALSSLVWTWLLTARGRFWVSGPTLEADVFTMDASASVAVVIPARNEAEHIVTTLASLLQQSYCGPLAVIVVDDNSTDGTGQLAEALAVGDARLHVVRGAPLRQGWTGKMWAVSQGLAHPSASSADYVLLTDADIGHGPTHIAQLVAKASRSCATPLDLVSEMVTLRTESFAERALIPAFVFFFQMLYPFRWVNDPTRVEAAAAGGTMLLSRSALDRIGNVDRIRGELIDDVALAREVKQGGHRIWLGHALEAESLRSYPTLRDVYDMVARTAYVQLDHSPLLLAGTAGGMALVYLVPLAMSLGTRGSSRRLGLLAWGAMAVAMQPTLHRYRRSPLWGLALPAIAVFYTAATVGSALRHYRGRGGQWKGRSYA